MKLTLEGDPSAEKVVREEENALNYAIWAGKSEELKQKVFDQVLIHGPSVYGVEFLYRPDGFTISAQTEINRNEVHKISMPPGYYVIQGGHLSLFRYPPFEVYGQLK